MAENTQQKNNKNLIVVIIIVAALVIAGLVTVIFMLLDKKEPEAPANQIENNFANGQIQYQQHGVIALDADSLQAAMDAASQEIADGYVSLDFNNYAESADGVNFECYLGNSVENTYDVYFDMYLDSTFSQRVMITGLIPPGSGIDTFTSEIDLEPGTYEAVLVLTQVEDDHSTIHRQTNVQINLNVRG